MNLAFIPVFKPVNFIFVFLVHIRKILLPQFSLQAIAKTRFFLEYLLLNNAKKYIRNEILYIHILGKCFHIILGH
jgi:hypothetical protein